MVQLPIHVRKHVLTFYFDLNRVCEKCPERLAASHAERI